MSRIVWTAEKGWHDGPPCDVTNVGGRMVISKHNPEHIDGADLWDCPCRECTRLDHSAGDTGMSLAEHRRVNFPEEWGGETE